MRLLACVLTALTCAFSFAAPKAQASAFDIAPITLVLSAKMPSGMLVVTNRGDEALRFQVSAFAWDQKPTGEMVLNPTKDIVFFPAMLTLKPGEARNLRVGMNNAPGTSEKSYRVFVQELPPLVTKTTDPGTIRVLTKMGIPIFIAPSAPKPVPVLTNLALRGKSLSFDVKNAGNAHFRSEKILVTTRDATKVTLSQEVDGWYMLAGGIRNYAVDLPAIACDGLKSLQIELHSEMGVVKADLANARCGPPGH
jgi:fimbrial chaperone protein